MRSTQRFMPTWASPPGETISDILRRRKLTVPVFARRLGWEPSEVDDLLRGHTAVTAETAQLLAQILGASAAFWSSREFQFREDVARLTDSEQPAAKKAWLGELPLRDMKKFGWIPRHSRPVDQADACLHYFGVRTIEAWLEKYRDLNSVVAFRTSGTFQSAAGAVAAWFRRGELEASTIECNSWNADKLRSVLPTLRSLSRKKAPEIFLPELRKQCADCGVVMAVVRAPNGCRASGATRFIAPDKALLLLSFRYRSDDHFWFTFFHEVGHLLLHGKKALFIEGTDMLSTHEEEEANEFSAELLIPRQYHSDLPSIVGSYKDVMRFARRIGVSPGIVVGQLQHKGLLARNQMNYLKYRYAWVSSAE